MVTKKTSETGNRFLEELDRIKKDMGNVVDERWYVVEVQPGYESNGYYGSWHPAVVNRVSIYFDNEAAADRFIETHNADEGKHLAKRHEELYERIVREWR